MDISPTSIDAWQLASERMLADLRREGIGYAASCRFVLDPKRQEHDNTKRKHETHSTDSSVRRQHDGQR